VLIESPGILLPEEAALIETFKRRGGKVVWTEEESWLAEFQNLVERPSIKIDGPATVRAVVRDQSKKRIVHLLNLNVERLSSFEDKVNPVSDLRLQLRLPFATMKSVKALTADPEASQGLVPYKLVRDRKGAYLEITVPRLVVSTLLVIE